MISSLPVGVKPARTPAGRHLEGMAFELPPSLRAERHPVEEEVAEYRDMPAEDRLRLLSMACRMSADLARARPGAAAVFAWRDELPESTKAVFLRWGVAWESR